MESRFLAFLIWGLGTAAIYTIVLVQEWIEHRRHRDARSRRDLRAAIALFMTAMGSSLAISLVLLGESGASLRSVALGVSLGAFTGAGIIMADNNRRRQKS